WGGRSPAERIFPEEQAIPKLVAEDIKSGTLTPEEARQRVAALDSAVEKIDEEKSGPENRGARAEARKKLFQVFYLETAKLPKEEAEERTKVLSAYLLARSKYDRKKAELEAEVKEGRK